MYYAVWSHKIPQLKKIYNYLRFPKLGSLALRENRQTRRMTKRVYDCKLKLYVCYNPSEEMISSSAHQRGESLGTASSALILVISLSLAVTFFIVGLSFGL